MKKSKKMDVVGMIMDFESGQLSVKDTVDLFAHLVKTGMAWTLQGFYGRTAAALIDGGYISADGKVLTYPS